MLIRLFCVHELTKHVCKISRLNSKRLLRKLQKLLGGYFILPHPVCDLRTHGAPDSERDQKNKHHIFAPTAGARSTIFPKLCMMIELVVRIKIHFLIQHIVFPTGCTEKFGLIDGRTVS